MKCCTNCSLSLEQFVKDSFHPPDFRDLSWLPVSFTLLSFQGWILRSWNDTWDHLLLYSWPLNNMSLNCHKLLMHGFIYAWIFFFFQINTYYSTTCGFPSSSVVKNLPGNAGDVGLIPGLEDPLQYSCLKNSMDRPALWATYSPWGVTKESDMTERLSMPACTVLHNPLLNSWTQNQEYNGLTVKL